MKKINIYIGLLFLMVMASCSKDVVLEKDPSNQQKGASVIHVSATSDTRVAIDGLTVKWKDGDYVDLYESGQDGKFTHSIRFNIVPSSISTDGKSANFQSEENLVIGKKYIAVHGKSKIAQGNLNDALNGLIHLDATTPKQEDGYRNVEDVLLMKSYLIEATSSDILHFELKHIASILEFRIKLDAGVTESFCLNRIEISADSDCFLKDAYCNTSGNIVTTSVPSVKTLSMHVADTLLSSKSEYVATMMVMWNPSVTPINGDFNITAYGLDRKNSSVTKKAKVLSAGKIYKSEITLTNIDIPIYESTDYSQDGKWDIIQRATVGNGVSLFIMGDGFVDKDMATDGKYDQRMRRAMENYFSIEPTKSYREYFNVYVIRAVSKHEGGNYDAGTETVFEVKFGDGTAISGNNNKVAEYAQKTGADVLKGPIIVVVNSPRYGGTCFTSSLGRTISYCPIAYDSEEYFESIIHHEVIGHGTGFLADEYIYRDELIPEETKAQFIRERISHKIGYNLTVDYNDVPWSHFMGKSKYDMVGLYEGGYFFLYGVWRAEYNSCMNDNVPYFNGPSRELIVKRIKDIAGEVYSWDDFVAKDKIVLPKRTKTLLRPFVPLAPPVLIYE